MIAEIILRGKISYDQSQCKLCLHHLLHRKIQIRVEYNMFTPFKINVQVSIPFNF